MEPVDVKHNAYIYIYFIYIYIYIYINIGKRINAKFPKNIKIQKE